MEKWVGINPHPFLFFLLPFLFFLQFCEIRFITDSIIGKLVIYITIRTHLTRRLCPRRLTLAPQ